MRSPRSGFVVLSVIVVLFAVTGFVYRRPLYRAIVLGQPLIAVAEAAPEAGATALPAARTVADVLRLCGKKAQTKFADSCAADNIAYPPRRVRLIAFKEEKVLEVWAANRTGAFHRLATYPIRAASGHVGPKSREGDRQVPEGFYRLTTMNPMSSYHLSMRVDYPNTADRAANPSVPVSDLGGDIYVHGNAVSIGCLAMGDAAIEEIFCLVAQAQSRDIWISPVDPRQTTMPNTENKTIQARYAQLRQAIRAMPLNP